MEEVQRKQALELEESDEATIWSRRDFLSLTAWGGVLAFLSTVSVAFLRFMFPRVLFEPNPRFDAGRADTYQPSAVDERFKQSHRTWIVRYEDGSFFAMLAICTHLGCTPNWLEGDKKFKCPCHGSGFKISGVNFEGPAPRPLERYAIRISEDGQVIVDKSRKFQKELGQWTDGDSFVVW